MRIPGYMLPQTATLFAFTGATAHGPQWSATSTAFRCRLEPSRTLYRDQDGAEIPVQARLFTFPELAINPQDRITCAGITYEVVTVERFPGPTGAIHHLECLLR